MPIIAGIDGCPTGWLCLVKDMDTRKIQAHILKEIADILTLTPAPEIIMIDIPIGLPDSGSRQCDMEARSLLKPKRSSSVFPTPVRPIMAAKTYAEACDIGSKTDGRKISQQAWAIVPKIRQVDEFLQSDLRHQKWLREVHPEICFREWNSSTPMAHGKKKAEGKSEREFLVRTRYATAYAEAQSSLKKSDYENDDLIDAFAALWTAERVFEGKARTIPKNPPEDSTGLRMEMVV